MDKKDILIRLLKEGHINEEEFKMLYDEPKEIIVKEKEVVHEPFSRFDPSIPTPPFNPYFTSIGIGMDEDGNRFISRSIS